MTEPQPVLANTTDAEMSERMVLFTVLWFAYLGQWGPKPGDPGRRQHQWRLHMILRFMEEVEGDLEDDKQWVVFLNTVPGFVDYWACGHPQAQHLQE